MRITQNADTRITMKIKWIRLAVISVLITVLVVSITGGLYMILDDKIEGTIINEYSGRQKKPKIAICADGKYYTLDNTYGSPVYYFFEGHLPDSREYLFETEGGEIVDIAAEGKWLVWGTARFSKERYIEYNAYNSEERAAHTFRIVDTENVKQYPFVALSHGKAFFAECVYPEKQIVIWQHDLESGQEKEIYRFDSYEQYKPLLETAGDCLYTPVAMTDGRVNLAEYNIVTGEDRIILLPGQVDVLFSLDYDADSENFVLYYRDESKHYETISLYKEETGHLKQIGRINAKQRMERDKLLFWNGNVVWVEYNDTWYVASEIDCKRYMRVYNMKKGRTYTLDQDRVVEFFFDDNALYGISLDENNTHLLNLVKTK